MNKKILGIILAAVVIATAVFVFKRTKQTTPEEREQQIATLQPVDGALKTNQGEHVVGTAASSDASAQAVTAQPVQEESYEQKLLKQGYIQDPENSHRMMKTVEENGKKKIYYEDKNPDFFEPTDKTSKEAFEVLASKKNADPIEEMRTLGRLDDKDINNAMLSGSFRDNDNDLELRLSVMRSDTDELLPEDFICFISPKLNMNFKKQAREGGIRADGTGYGVVKLNEKTYLRVMWSFEKKRIVHGEIISVESGAPVITKTFNATEVHVSRGEKLKYCD